MDLWTLLQGSLDLVSMHLLNPRLSHPITRSAETVDPQHVVYPRTLADSKHGSKDSQPCAAVTVSR